jgi:secretion/DNA translocation related CpaE-like protein
MDTTSASPSAVMPLVVTGDDVLLDEVLRLAAAAGCTPEVAGDASAALRGWSGAPVVLVGADLAADLARAVPPRRPGVHVVTATDPPPPDLFPAALGLGAESVAALDAAGEWVVEVLTDLVDPGTARGLTVGVIGGSGGAGASTLACALGQVAARSGPAVVVDLDPLGPGLDRVLGLEDRDGVRWDDLAVTTGRLGARALRHALPGRGDLRVLTWPAAPGVPPSPAVVRETLTAAQRGHDVVVVDLPRVDADLDEVAARCDLLLVVAVGSVPGVASAARLCTTLPDPRRSRLVLRRAADPAAVEAAVGLPVLVAMTDQRGLDESIDLGLGPVRSRGGPLSRASREVLAALAAA